MAAPGAERKLAAIVSADVAGYSRLMAADEDATVRTLAAYRDEVGLLLRHHRGRLVDFTGDNWLAEFPTATAAVSCAIDVQDVLDVRNARLPTERRMQFRIGVHLGEVRVEEKRLYGDGVNIAARLQSLAEPGAVCVSQAVRDQLGTKLAVSYRDLGAQSLKNIPEPVRAYQVRSVQPAAVPTAVTPPGRRWAANASIAVVAVAAIVAGWVLLTREGGAPASPIRSLAVLPLENLSGDPEQEYFADGMTETLIGDLGKIGALKVISRTSVMQYKRARKPLREIAKELGVDALLEGTVIRDDDRVRVTAQLIDGRTDHHLWSERYDRDLRNVLELQSDVARAVAREIELELTPVERALLADRPQVNRAAHEALLKGIYQSGRFTPETMRNALESFQHAIELDPGYALAHAWAGLAWVFLTNAFYVVPDVDGWPKAKAAALRALELDDTLAFAHSILGNVALNSEWDWPAAEEHYKRALELNPSLSAAHVGYAFYLTSCRRNEQAIAEAHRAVELDPLNLLARTWPAGLLHLMGRYQDALEAVRASAVLEMDPGFRPALGQLGGIYGALGRYDEVIPLWERAGLWSPEDASALRSALAAGGANGYLREVLRIVRARPVAIHMQLARLHALLGERDEAFAELELAYAASEGDLVWVRTFPPGLESIRDDPRFDDLVRRIGIPES